MLVLKYVCTEINMLLRVYNSLSAEDSPCRQCPDLPGCLEC